MLLIGAVLERVGQLGINTERIVVKVNDVVQYLNTVLGGYTASVVGESYQPGRHQG